MLGLGEKFLCNAGNCYVLGTVDFYGGDYLDKLVIGRQIIHEQELGTGNGQPCHS